MAEEQKSLADKKKLPIRTKIAAWILIVIAIIFCLLAIGYFIALGSSSNTDFSMYAPFAAMIGFGIAVVYFLPGILLLKSRNIWGWIPSVVILCAGVLIPFVFLIREFYVYLNWGLTPYLSVRPECLGFSLSFLVPLILVLLDKLSYKFVVPIPIILVVITLGCFFSVSAKSVSSHEQVLAFETRMYSELHDLYGKAVEDGYTEGCQSCAEVSQYFNEQWNQLDPHVRAQSYYDIDNEIRHRDCLMAIAYLTENISICDCVEAIDYSEGSGSDHEQCRKAVQALVADDVSVCSLGDECTTIFATMTDNPSLCDQLPYYDIDNCHARYDQAQEDPYNYLGLFWRSPVPTPTPTMNPTLTPTPGPTYNASGECAPGCPYSWSWDEYCDTACNVPECNYDNGVCSGGGIDCCAPGCKPFWVGDGICDGDCNNAACGYDGGDCAH
jgi:hypothetical protein